MNIEQFYSVVGGDYTSVIGRLRKEDRVIKYILRFPDDAPSVSALSDAISIQDWDNLFMLSHTLKGCAANLSLDDIFDKASAVCEEVRGSEPNKGKPPVNDLAPMMDELEKAVRLFSDTLPLLDH